MKCKQEGPLLRTMVCIAMLLVLTGIPGQAQSGRNNAVSIRIPVLPHLEIDAEPSGEPGSNANTAAIAGTEPGFAELFNKEVEIVFSSRPASPEEERLAAVRGIQLQGELLGWTGVGVAIHPANSISELSMDQLHKIFTGVYTNWRQLGGLDEPITVLLYPEETSGPLRFFRKQVLRGDNFISNSSREQNSKKAILEVSSTPGSITAVPFNEVFYATERVRIKAVAVKKDNESPAVTPDGDPMKNSSYPISEPLYVYYDSGANSEQVKQFVDYCKKELFKGMDK
ncbi:MAG TPA: substrate-binding domain-containing protein [Desulfomonilaceae bacterium]|nr:substrate-binding domain-containing protein [Desulfomonilaceae bacterium]